LKGKNVRFPNSRKNQVNGIHQDQEIKLQYKEAAMLPLKRVLFVSATVQFTLQDVFSFTSSLHDVFFSHPLLHDFVFAFSPPSPITFSNGPS